MQLQLGNYTNKNLIDKVNNLETKVDASGFLKKNEDAEITSNFTFTNNVKLNGTPTVDNDAVHKKFVTDITTSLEAEYDSLVTKVELVETSLTGKINANTGNITTNTSVIDELKNRVSTIEGSVFVIGTIEKSSQEVAQSNLLDEFVQQTVSREKRKGDLVITNDNYNFYYNGAGWVKAGVRIVDFASTASAGIVKLGSEEGQLEQVDAQGLVKVKGYAELKAQSDTTKSNLETNYYNKTTIDQKVEKLTQADATINEKVVQLESKITELKTSFKSVDDPEFTDSNNSQKGQYQYTIQNDGTKLIQVLQAFVENSNNGSLDGVLVDAIVKDNNTIVYSDINTIKKIVYMELKIGGN